MQKTPKIITSSPYQGHDVKADPYEGYHLYQPIIDNTIEQLNAMLSKYKRVYTFRLDLHFPDEFDSSNKQASKYVSQLFNETSGYLRKKAKKPRVSSALRNHRDVCYQWALETGKNNKPHLHCWIAVDGNKNYKTGWTKTETEPATGIAGLIETKWEAITDGGSIHVVTGGRMLTHKNVELYTECIEHYSYLAKVKDKYDDTLQKHTRNHGKSHIKTANNCHPSERSVFHIYRRIAAPPYATTLIPRQEHSERLTTV